MYLCKDIRSSQEYIKLHVLRHTHTHTSPIWKAEGNPRTHMDAKEHSGGTTSKKMSSGAPWEHFQLKYAICKIAEYSYIL